MLDLVYFFYGLGVCYVLILLVLLVYLHPGSFKGSRITVKYNLSSFLEILVRFQNLARVILIMNYITIMS